MQSDRELLELAAKAAGLRLTWGEKYRVGDDEVDCTDIPYALSDSPDEGPAYWNPLEDDGDALRLAVKLRIDVYLGRRGSVLALSHGGAVYDEKESNDPYAATRRAIVRAAAAIGGDSNA